MGEANPQYEENAYNMLPPDIVLETLPFLSPDDIKNLSGTNRYFHKLLNYSSSETLWHELFHKAYGTPHTNDEPFQLKESEELRTCGEVVMTENFSELSWQEKFKIRTEETRIYTWGCLKHARLGYTATSHGNISQNSLSNVGFRQLRSGTNRPTEVPWYKEDNKTNEDASIVQVSSGGFSFQILTKSGKLYSTGSTFTGGHRGPSVPNGEYDYNPFSEAIHELESTIPRIRGGDRTFMTTTGVFPSNIHGPTPTMGPHNNIYEELEDLEKKARQTIPGNDHIRRMFTRDSFDIFTSDTNSLTFDEAKLDLIKYVSVSSGRSHFLALDDKNEIYSWDTPESEYGIRICFKGLPPKSSNPILKIGCGWDMNCAYIYNVGLVIWNTRTACKKEECSSDALYEVIPHTGDINGPNKIIDFACYQTHCVFYVTNENTKLWKYSAGITELLDINFEGNIMKVSVCFSSLVIFTDLHCYMLEFSNNELNLESLRKLDIPDEEDRIISVVCGDYHALALTEKGQIYSWGLESQLCGCLGLGGPEDVIDRSGLGRWDGIRNMRVCKPTKIRLDSDYVCVGITAGGWQSGALIIKN